MHISKSYAALAATAFAAILAGCSGGSQVAPSVGQGGGVQSVVKGHSPTIDIMGHLGNRLPVLSENKFSGPGIDATKPVIFMSGNLTGNVYVFNEDKPTNPTKTCSGCGGWGLAVKPGLKPLLASGNTSGGVNIYTLPSLTSVQTLALTGGGNAYGLCFDSKGGLWADNWPTGTIDHWTAPQTVGGGTHSSINVSGDATVVYYIACDTNDGKVKENTLYAYGYNPNNSQLPVNVDAVNTTTGAETAEFNAGSLAAGTGFPGGIAISAKDDLAVNDQYGTLYEAGTKEPWKGSGSVGCTWGFNPNDWTTIAYDNTQKEIWGGDINFGSSTLMEIAVSAAASPIKSGSCATGESGGPSTAISNDEPLGIAVYPNLGN